MTGVPDLYAIAKRALDLGLAAAGLVLMSPVLAVAAVAIRLESSGPVLFRQERIGRAFRPFTIYKLRTMRADSAASGPSVTSSGDVRVTRVGRFLRRSKLDELPQLWNVLKGDMSLVGPRPEVAKYVDAFRSDYTEVLTVRPGVTDLASLTFRDEERVLAASVDPEAHYTRHVLPAKLALNKEYVRRSSLAFDLEIILKTVLEAVWLRALPIAGWALRHRASIVVAIHVAMIVMASYGAFWLRFDGAIPPAEVRLWSQTVLVLLLIRLPIFALFRLYQGLWSYTSIYDLQSILVAVVGSELLFFSIIRIVLAQISYPRSVFILDALLLIFLMGAARLAKRFYEESGQLRASRRALIVGSADRVDFVIRAMKSRVLGDYRPIGIVMTTSGGIGRIHGVPVLGGLENIHALVSASIADEIVLAYDRSLAVEDQRVLGAVRHAGMPVRDAFQLMAAVVDAHTPPDALLSESAGARRLVHDSLRH